MPPEVAARHRLDVFRGRLTRLCGAVAPNVVPTRPAAARHFLRTGAIDCVHWVCATTSRVEGAYIRLWDEVRDIRSQAPVGSSARIPLVFAL